MGVFANNRLPVHAHDCCDTVFLPPVQLYMDVTVDQLDDDTPVALSQVASPKKLNRVKKAELTARLIELRTALFSASGSDYLLVGPTICTGLSDTVIKQIVTTIHHLDTEDDVLSLGVTSLMYCSPILQLIQENKSD